MKHAFLLFSLFCFMIQPLSMQAQPVFPLLTSSSAAISGQNYQVLTLEEYEQYKLQNTHFQNQVQEQVYFGEVSPEQIPILVAQLKAEKNKAASDQRISIETGTEEERAAREKQVAEQKSQEQSAKIADQAWDKAKSSYSNKSDGGSSGNLNLDLGNSKDLGAILLVAMALVIVVGGAIYITKTIYDINNDASGLKTGYMPYSGVDLYHYSPTPDELKEDPSLQSESGHLLYTGITFLPTLKKTSFGLQLEGGRIDGTFMQEGGTGIIQIQSSYVAIGGIMNITGEKYSQVFISFLGGVSQDERVGIVMIGRAGVMFGKKEGFRAGMTVGGLGLSLDSDAGLARNGLPVNLILGLQMGYTF